MFWTVVTCAARSERFRSAAHAFRKELRRRLVELPAFVEGTDDEYAHVEFGGSVNRRAVDGVVDEIPVEVGIVELAGFDCFDDEIGRPVGGETNVADAALFF